MPTAEPSLPMRRVIVIALTAVLIGVVLLTRGGEPEDKPLATPPAKSSICDQVPSPCTSHVGWPEVDGVLLIQREPFVSASFTGTDQSDELLGHHASDTLVGGASADILWGDYDPDGNGPNQTDRMYGGTGRDWIYASHGTNYIQAGPGNDRVRAHYGRGTVDCGSGWDRLHYARTRRHLWKFKNCEAFWK